MPVSGPFFSPGMTIIVKNGVKDIEKKVADVADARVEILHRAFFRRPTPYYWTKVRAMARNGYHVVTDGGIVYGHWLEGTGSMNAPKTRFKGYRSFRLTTLSVKANMRAIVAKPLADLVRRLN